MRAEEMQLTSKQPLFRRSVIRSRAEALAETKKSCGRFKSPDSLEQRLRAFVTESLLQVSDVDDSFLLGAETPLNWQNLLLYLHENGIIQEPRFTERYYRNDYPRLFHFIELATGTKVRNSNGQSRPISGFGGSFDKEEAMGKAVGETLERYFLSRYKREMFRTASYAEISRKNRALDIRSLDFFAPWQKEKFPEFNFDKTSIFQWVRAREYATGNSIYVPAQLAYWNYEYNPRDAAPEKTITIQTTSGSAGHFSHDEAVLAAALEAIQRDAFLIYWLNLLSPRVIDLETVESDTIQQHVKKLRANGFDVMFFNTSSDFAIPIATCVITDISNPHDPIFSLGSAAGFTIEETFISSMIEALIVLQYTSLRKKYVLGDNYVPFTDRAISRSERLSAWQGPEMLERFKFFVSGSRQTAREFIGGAEQFDTAHKQLSHVRREFTSKGGGYELYVYEVKNKILDAIGYHVVRAIVPALTPLYLDEHAATINSRRIREIPERIGYKAAKKLNPWPHPFP